MRNGLLLPYNMDKSTEQLFEAPAPELLKKLEYFLKKEDKRKIMKQLPDIHEAAFEKIDCLDCARCCKNYSPRFKMPDIKRISKYLGLKETAFIDTYLAMDNEGDYVLQQKPCVFLGKDNACSIYEHRPSDCQRFPYTDEDTFFKRIPVTMKNAEFCPAVHSVMKDLLSK
jgi:Fe-S-cluster containining protein